MSDASREHTRRAFDYDKEGEKEKAIAEYLMALAADARDHVALNNLGYIYLEQGKFKEAVNYLRSAIAACPRFDLAYANLGLALRQAKR